VEPVLARGRELAYFDSAGLIAKYYSLGVHTDEAGKADKVEYAKAFDNMLATAERNARASARAARIATGAIPVQAKLAYQVAMVERGGELDEKLDALAGAVGRERDVADRSHARAQLIVRHVLGEVVALAHEGLAVVALSA